MLILMRAITLLFIPSYLKYKLIVKVVGAQCIAPLRDNVYESNRIAIFKV